MLTFHIFFFNDTATTEIYTLSLHDALPIWGRGRACHRPGIDARWTLSASELLGRDEPVDADQPLSKRHVGGEERGADRKSTRLNSSHANISYAVFCLKKKKQIKYCPSTSYI